MSYDILLLLVAVAMLAGFVDSIAGGGGLIAVPALMLAGLTPVQAIATNKLQASFGVGMAAHHFYKAGLVDVKKLKIPVVFAVFGAALGAFTLNYVDASFLKKIMPFALIAVAVYFLISPKPQERGVTISPLVFGMFFATPIAFYDGFFGPGAGSFFMLSLVAFWGLSLLKANAQMKFLNLTSNLVSLGVFIYLGHVVWIVGLTMALGQLVGAKLGAKAAVRFGANLIRPLIVVISVALALRILIWG